MLENVKTFFTGLITGLISSMVLASIIYSFIKAVSMGKVVWAIICVILSLGVLAFNTGMFFVMKAKVEG
jgi:accessory gene regulator protein AgrB